MSINKNQAPCKEFGKKIGRLHKATLDSWRKASSNRQNHYDRFGGISSFSQLCIQEPHRYLIHLRSASNSQMQPKGAETLKVDVCVDKLERKVQRHAVI